MENKNQLDLQAIVQELDYTEQYYFTLFRDKAAIAKEKYGLAVQEAKDAEVELIKTNGALENFLQAAADRLQAIEQKKKKKKEQELLEKDPSE